LTGRRLRRDTKGSTTVEFAVVGTMLCLMTFAIIETGVLWWLRAGIQLTASEAARCWAIGSTYGTTPCTSASATQNYALQYAMGTVPGAPGPAWLFANILTTSDVTVSSGRVASCNGFTGTNNGFFTVSITHLFPSMPPPLGNYTSLSASACYPGPLPS
jgi:Flp pilus assembly protein TadG